MKIIAIDDEPIALSIIQEFCQRLGDMQLQTFTEPAAGMAAVAAECPDLLFLDIRLDSADGVALARQLPSNQFVRIHKSFVVSLLHVKSYTRQQVYIHHVVRPLPVGRTFAATVQSYLK